MRITIELPVSEVREICRITREGKKGAAIRRFVADALRFRRRAALVEKFVTVEWGVELSGLEESQTLDRNHDRSSTSRRGNGHVWRRLSRNASRFESARQTDDQSETV